MTSSKVKIGSVVRPQSIVEGWQFFLNRLESGVKLSFENPYIKNGVIDQKMSHDQNCGKLNSV